jgi:hypothetical protein
MSIISNLPPAATDADKREVLAYLHGILPMREGLDPAVTAEAEMLALAGASKANLDRLKTDIATGRHGHGFMPSSADLGRMLRMLSADHGVHQHSDWDTLPGTAPAPRGQTAFQKRYQAYKAGDMGAMTRGIHSALKPNPTEAEIEEWERKNNCTIKRWDGSPRQPANKPVLPTPPPDHRDHPEDDPKPETEE